MHEGGMLFTFAGFIMYFTNSLMCCFRPCNERTQTCWGYTFELSPYHLQPEQAKHLKFSYDELGEIVLNELNGVSPGGEELPTHFGRHRDLYALLRENAASNQVLGAFWKEINTVPAWVDWSQISRGQEVFYRYGGPALTGLAFQSLL